MLKHINNYNNLYKYQLYAGLHIRMEIIVCTLFKITLQKNIKISDVQIICNYNCTVQMYN